MQLLSSRQSRRKASVLVGGLLVLILLGAGLAVLLGPGAPSQAEAEAAAEDFVRGIERSLPMRINRGTTWTAVTAEGGEVRYTYRLAEALPDGQLAGDAMQTALVRQFCTIDPARDVMRRGVVFAFQYVWQGEDTGRTIRLSAADCAALE